MLSYTNIFIKTSLNTNQSTDNTNILIKGLLKHAFFIKPTLNTTNGRENTTKKNTLYESPANTSIVYENSTKNNILYKKKKAYEHQHFR